MSKQYSGLFYTRWSCNASKLNLSQAWGSLTAPSAETRQEHEEFKDSLSYITDGDR